jgi:hypothetical protein
MGAGGAKGGGGPLGGYVAPISGGAGQGSGDGGRRRWGKGRRWTPWREVTGGGARGRR